MARLTDHDQRDAEHVLRAEIGLALARYSRRMLDKGKAYITEAIAQSAKEGSTLDGPTIGRTAAQRVKAEYFVAKPESVVEVNATRQLDSGEDNEPESIL